jgi:general stress protein 26
VGYEGEGFGDEYVEYEGKVSFNHSEELKKELWNEDMKVYFDGPDDPAFTVLEIKPIHIRLMNKKGEPPMNLEL